MIQKREFSIFVISLLLITFISSFAVAAVSDEITDFFSGFGEGLQSIGLGTDQNLTIFFFAIILGMVTYTVISSVFRDANLWVHWTISGAVTGLSLLGIPWELLESLRSSYGAMGAAILFVIPFMIILAFTVRVDNLFIARLTWFAFSFYYIILYFGGVYDCGSLKVWNCNASQLWDLVGLSLGIVAFLGIRGVRELMWKGRIEELKEGGMRDIEFRGVGRELEREETKARTTRNRR